jgi:hypothetical protein
MTGIALVGKRHVTWQGDAQELQGDSQISQLDFTEIRLTVLAGADHVRWRSSSDEVDEASRKLGDVDVVEDLSSAPNCHLFKELLKGKLSKKNCKLQNISFFVSMV